jgi:hypothetical protein
VASLVDGEVQDGSISEPDVVVEGDPDALYAMFLDGRLDKVDVEGDRALLEQLVQAAPPMVDLPAAPAAAH